MIKTHNVTRIVAACILLTGNGFMSYSQDKNHGVNIGLVYPLSTLGVHSTEYSNVFSAHAILGMSREETGFAAAGIGNIIKENASGFQASGILNKIGGNTNGFTGAGIANFYHNGRGAQYAGVLNLSNGNINGIQGSGFMNIAKNIEGVQASGFINMADSIHGVQGSGFISLANDVDGTQVSGFINIARNVKGPQISGFINIADSSDYPIAPINIIKNGEMFLGVTYDDNRSTIVTFRSGSRKLYGVAGIGYNFKNSREVFVIQYGFGAHLVTRNNFKLNTEGTITHLEGSGHGKVVKTSLSVLPAVKIGRKVEIFAGPSINYVNSTSYNDRDFVGHYIWHHTSSHDYRQVYGMYVGYTAGVHIAM